MIKLYDNYKRKGICFYLGKRTPRQNEYERGVKYFLIYGGAHDTILNSTGYCFSTVQEARAWIKNNYFVFM